MAVKTYRKKPVVIEAVLWDGSNLDEVKQFCAGAARYELMARGNYELVIGTLEDGEDLIAKHVASKGDWIIKGVQGEFYPCKPDIFEATYDPADTPSPQPIPFLTPAPDIASENERLRAALEKLVKSANEVNRLGASTGPQWLTMTVAIVSANAALERT